MVIRALLFLLSLLCLISCTPEQKEDEESGASEQEIVEVSIKQKDDVEDKDDSDNNNDATKDKVVNKNNSSNNDFSILPSDIVIGDPKSKVVLVEYFAHTCPHCGIYHKLIFPEIKAKYIDTNKIAYVLREFIQSKQELDASLLARCKGDTQSYWKFTDVLLSKQDGWAFNKNYREILTNIGSLGGVSPEQFAACLDDRNKLKILIENTKIANNVPNFPGTPAFFINGNHFKNKYTAEELSKAIDKELSK